MDMAGGSLIYVATNTALWFAEILLCTNLRWGTTQIELFLCGYVATCWLSEKRLVLELN